MLENWNFWWILVLSWKFVFFKWQQKIFRNNKQTSLLNNVFSFEEFHFSQILKLINFPIFLLLGPLQPSIVFGQKKLMMEIIFRIWWKQFF